MTVDKNEQVKNKIREFCSELEVRLLEKYKKGQDEHGNDWTGLDIGYEMGCELLDLINYSIMRVVRKDLTDK